MPRKEYGSIDQQVQEAQAKIAQEDGFAHEMATLLAPLGGKVKLQGLKNTAFNDKWYDLCGMDFDSEKGLMYHLRVSAATSTHAFNAKYIKVNSEKVVAFKQHPYSSVFLDNVGVITALLSANLNPADLVCPEFVIDPEYMNGYNDFNVYHYAEKHGLNPVFGYIVSPKSDSTGNLACGIHAHNHVGFYKKDVLYVPVEHSVVSSMIYKGKPVPRFFIPDVAISPKTLEVLRTVSQLFFPQSMPSGGNMLVSPFRSMSIEHKNPLHLHLWQASQHIPVLCTEPPHEPCTNYLHLYKAACVVDHSLALAMNSAMEFIDIPMREKEVTEDFQSVFMMSMGPQFDYHNHPMLLAKECCHCHCISLDYTLVKSKGVTNAYCSEACFRVQKRGGAEATSYAAFKPNIPHWKKLQEMDVFPRKLAKVLKEEIDKCNKGRNGADVNVVDEDDTETGLATVAKSPFPTMCTTINPDLECGFEMHWRMPDGVIVSEDFARRYSRELMDKIEATLSPMVPEPQIEHQQTNTSGTVQSSTQRRTRFLRDQEEQRIKAQKRYQADRAAAIARYHERESIAAAENRLADIEKRIRVLQSREAAEKERIKTEQRIENASRGRNRPSGKKDRVRSRKEIDDDTLERHEQWVTTEAREARMMEGELKKQIAHSEAEARKIKAAIEAKRAAQAEIGKQQAAREHKLPEPLTMADALEAATVAKAISASVITDH